MPFHFKELIEVAKGVRFKDDAKLTLLQGHMEKLEKAIVNNKKNEFDLAIKDLKEITRNKSHGFHFKEFLDKLEQLSKKVKSRGLVFSDIHVGTREREDDDGCTQSERGKLAQMPKPKRTKTEQQPRPDSKEKNTELDECIREIELLIEKFQSACKENNVKEILDKKSSAGGAREKKSLIKERLDRVNKEADRIIDHLEMIRDTKNVKGRAQEKQVQNATENNPKMKIVADWLHKFKRQIDSDKIDVQVFQRINEEVHEVKHIKTCLEDICVKVQSIIDNNKSLTDENKSHIEELQQQREIITKTWMEEFSEQKSKPKDTPSSLKDIINTMRETKQQLNKLTTIQETLQSEIASLKCDLAHFDDLTKPTIPKDFKKQPEIVKEIVNIRKQLHEKKNENAKETENWKADKISPKVQQEVDVLWKVAFGSEFNNKEKKGDDNCLHMLGNITSEMKKLKDLQTNLNMEIQSLKDEVAHFDDPIEHNTTNISSERSEILNDIADIRKQLHMKRREVATGRERYKSNEMVKLKEHVVSLWKIAVGNEADLLSDKDDNGVVTGLVKMLGTITAEIKKLDKISFELEGCSHQIHEKLFGIPPSIKSEDELKTYTNVLLKAFETLQRCAKETKNLEEQFSELSRAMKIENQGAELSLKFNKLKENITRQSNDSESMKTILNKARDLLTRAYTELTAEPYLFTKPDVDFKATTEKFPDWLHPAAMSIETIYSCIQLNKESFNKRFTETDSIFKCLFQMYKEQTNEKYEDSWHNSGVQQTDGQKSPTMHVMFVIKDIYKQLCIRSEESICQRYQEQIRKLQDGNRALEEEKAKLLTRISKIAGANLTVNNPNIADLSDQNRPTKLAEQYSELYDNEWTNAFEALDQSKKSQKEIHSTLRDIIMETFKFCSELSRKQDSLLKTVLLSPCALAEFNSNEGAISKKQGDKTKGSAKSKHIMRKGNEEKEIMSTVQSNTLKELRKETANLSLESIVDVFESQQNYSKWFKPKALKDYTVCCIKLCWLMNVQSPPVYVDQDVAQSGSAFDTTKFKPYTTGEKKVDFVVWPALYLHQGGPLLSKGVAQGK